MSADTSTIIAIQIDTQHYLSIETTPASVVITQKERWDRERYDADPDTNDYIVDRVTLINCTPHPLHVRIDDDPAHEFIIPTSGAIARCAVTTSAAAPLAGVISVAHTTYGVVEWL